MDSYDLIIVGADPAGLCLARELATSRLRILVLDKKRSAEDVQYNTSGSYIDPVEWGLPREILNPVDTVFFGSHSEQTIKRTAAHVINRKLLLRFLDSEARKNEACTILYGAIITAVDCGAEGVSQITFDYEGATRSVSARVYADCSGAGGVLARKLGVKIASRSAVGIEYLVPLKREPHSIDLFIGTGVKGGYGWVFPLDAKTAIVGYGTLDQDCFSSIDERINAMWSIPRVAEHCEFKILKRDVAILRTGKPTGELIEKNVVLIGDTCVQANPLVGEGIRFVMDAARIAAPCIETALRTGDHRALKRYPAAWMRKYCRRYLLAYRAQEYLQKMSRDDARSDRATRRLQMLTDEEFNRVLRGDLGVGFLARVALKAVLK